MSIYDLNNDNIPEHIIRIITAIQKILKEKAYDFMLIGASARDVVLTAIHGQRSRRLTRDVDFALYIPEWSYYSDIMDELVLSGQFARTNVQHRLIFNETDEIDIVPFGEIQNEEGHYLWPPENIKSMTVAGFREISEHSITIRLTEPSLQFKVASIPGICIMKLFAWSDRKYADARDGKDLGFIIANYIELKWDILYEQYADIVDDPEFHTVSSSARILGREIFYLLQTNKHALQAIIEILKLELNDPDNSRLAISMAQGGIAGYVLAFESLEQLLKGIYDKSF